MNSITQIKGGRLTLREKEVLNFIAQGFSSKQIAAQLYISENTVANHRRNMLRKQGAKSSAELVRYNVINYAR